MRAPPYFPFFQRDFVHSCRSSKMSPDEIGGLVMLMCQQWEAMGDAVQTPEKFAAYTGWDIRVAKRLLTRLVSIEKVDQTDDGYRSSRMVEEITKYTARVRSAEAREERRRLEIGRTSSGSPQNFSEMLETSSEELSEIHNKINDGGTTEGALPDIRYQNHKESEGRDMPTEGVGTAAEDDDPKSRKPKAYTQHFEEFWAAFPVKDGKWAAFDKSWRKIGADDRERAIDGAKLYAARVKRESIERPKWAQGWLTDRRWEDELRRHAPAQSAEPRKPYWWEDPAKLASVDEEGWGRLIDKHANGTWPMDKLGPWPRHQRCVVPKSVIMNRGLWDLYDNNGICRGKTHA